MTVKVPLKGPVWTPDGSTPTPETLPDGQYKDHWILSDEERAKGFVRPVRTKYMHVVPKPFLGACRKLTEDEHKRFNEGNTDHYKKDYVLYETYANHPYIKNTAASGRFWTQAELDRAQKGCGAVTTMPLKIAETYATNPHFYGSTFCCGCGNYYPVGVRGEFFWATGNEDEKVGT